MAEAKFNLPFSLGLSDLPPDALDPKIRVVAEELYNAMQQVQLAFHNYLGLGQQLQDLWSSLAPIVTMHKASQHRIYLQSTEVLSYGSAISLFSDAGVLKMRLANATNNTRPAHGFCTVEDGVAAGDYAEAILFQGILDGFVGLVTGSRYFLSTVNGLLTAAAPVAAGNIEQALGIAVSTTTLIYQFDLHFIQH